MSLDAISARISEIRGGLGTLSGSGGVIGAGYGTSPAASNSSFSDAVAKATAGLTPNGGLGGSPAPTAAPASTDSLLFGSPVSTDLLTRLLGPVGGGCACDALGWCPACGATVGAAAPVALQTAPGLPDGAAQFQPIVREAAAATGLDPALINAVIWSESGFNPSARSHAGAIGLMQLMPATARMLGVDPTNARQNVMGGSRFLADMIDRFGRVDLALAAYNAGPGAVDRHGGIPPFKETQAYVPKVLGRAGMTGAEGPS